MRIFFVWVIYRPVQKQRQCSQEWLGTVFRGRQYGRAYREISVENEMKMPPVVVTPMCTSEPFDICRFIRPIPALRIHLLHHRSVSV